MRIPVRLHGILIGLVVLVAGPILALDLTPGTAARTAVSAAPPASAITADRSVRFLHVDIPELSAPEPSPTPTPAPTPVATPSPPPATAAPPASRTTVRPAAPRSAAPPPARPAPAPAAPPGTVQAIIIAAANAHGVSAAWMLKIAACESGYRPNAYNAAGPYIGLFQFLPSTFAAHGGTDIYDPTQQANITATMLAAGQSRAWGCA